MSCPELPYSSLQREQPPVMASKGRERKHHLEIPLCADRQPWDPYVGFSLESGDIPVLLLGAQENPLFFSSPLLHFLVHHSSNVSF